MSKCENIMHHMIKVEYRDYNSPGNNVETYVVIRLLGGYILGLKSNPLGYTPIFFPTCLKWGFIEKLSCQELLHACRTMEGKE